MGGPLWLALLWLGVAAVLMTALMWGGADVGWMSVGEWSKL